MGRFRHYLVGAGFGITLILYLIAAYGAAQVSVGLWDGQTPRYEQARTTPAAALGGALGPEESLESGLDRSQDGLFGTQYNREVPLPGGVSSPGQSGAREQSADS
jgi:hypothetical protein